MELAKAIRAVIATLRRRPADLLPFYLLSIAIPAIVRVVTIAGGLLLIGYLLVSGRVERLLDQLDTIDTTPPDPEANPDAFVAWLESLQPLADTLLTPTSVAVLLATIGVAIVLGLVLTAAVAAGQMATCFARLRQERGLVAGIRGVRAHWTSFLGLYLLELALWGVATLALAIVVGVSLLISPVLAVFVSIFAILFWVGAVVAIRAMFTFAPAAIVVEEVGVTASLRSSVEFIRAEFMMAAGYYAVAIGVLVGMAGVSSTLAVIGTPALTAIASFLVVAPALDLLKTVLFGDYHGAIRPPNAPEIGVVTQLKQGIRRGLAEMAGFVRATPGLHTLSIGTMAAGLWMGWVVAAPLVGDLEVSIRARSADFFPPTTAIELFGNNWTVAMATAYSGIAGGIPSAVGVWFNGLVIGALARLEVSLIELVAFVIPHGIFEIPGLLISGALGFYLGIETWRTWRGESGRRSLASAFERGFWVLVGVGVLLAVAGFIEGFISSWYFRLFL